MQTAPLHKIDPNEPPEAENERINRERPSKDSLKITEIFFSLQGESTNSGLPTIFIRLTGCPLRCTYCDSEYAFYGGEWMRFEEILQHIQQYKTQHICVTGGEPLAQRACITFLSELCDQGYHVSLETAGALSTAKVDSRVMVVMDVKTPSSNESHRNKVDNLERLKQGDQIKFVIGDREDYEWAKAFIDEHELNQKTEILFSSSFESLAPTELANWIIADALPVRFQMQLHKYLWGDVPGV